MFINNKYQQYNKEAKAKWENTQAYKEYELKTEKNSKDEWDNIENKMNNIFNEFSLCMKAGKEPNDAECQLLVKKLQDFISENLYNCTNEILAGLGRMYVSDERFKNNIDKSGEGSADFVNSAIKYYIDK